MPKTFSPEEKERLIALVTEKPDLTLEEIREIFSKDCSLMAIHRELKRLGFRFNKNAEGVRTRTPGHNREREKVG